QRGGAGVRAGGAILDRRQPLHRHPPEEVLARIPRQLAELRRGLLERGGRNASLPGCVPEHGCEFLLRVHLLSFLARPLLTPAPAPTWAPPPTMATLIGRFGVILSHPG